jgi:hypothetical protein
LPGIFGGLVAMLAVKGIFITGVIAIASGLVVGKILSLTGRRIEPCTDAEELIVD